MDGATAPEPPVRARRSRKTFVLLAVFAVLVVALGLVVSSFGDDLAAETTSANTVSEVTRGSMSESVSADGTVEAANTDDLSFTSAGTVTAVNVKAGDKVTAGQVLATIDPTELEAAVATADANVADAAAQLADSKSSGTDEQIAADEASLTSAYDALTSAKDDLANASLVATFDGTVAAVNLTAGEELGSDGTSATSSTGTGSGSGQSIPPLGDGSSTPNASATDTGSTDPQIQVVSKGSYEVTLNVGSSDIDSVAVGQAATLTVSTASSSSGGFPGFPGGGFPGGGGGATQQQTGGSGSGGGASQTQSTGATATGKVTEVAQVADTSSGVAQYPVTIAFTASADDFYVGSNVTGSITTKTRTNVLQVPVRAVTTATDGTTTVKVAVDGTADGKSETRTVKTGLTSDGNIEITKGLEAGEKVIVAGIGGIPTGGAGGGNGTTGGGGFPNGGGAGGGFPTGGPTGGNG